MGCRARGLRKPVRVLSRTSRALVALVEVVEVEVVEAMVVLRSVGTTVDACCCFLVLGRMEVEAKLWMKELAMADVKDMMIPEKRPRTMAMVKKTITGYYWEENGLLVVSE